MHKTNVVKLFIVGLALLLFVGLTAGLSFAKEGSITLKYASYQPSTSKLYLVQGWWADQVAKRTGGKVKVKLYPGQQICGAKEMIDGIATGLTDIGGVSPSYTPAKLAMHTIDFVPMLAPVRADHQMMILNGDKFLNHPAIKKENDERGVVNLFTLALPGYSVISNRPIEKIEDFKNLKIRATGMLAPLFRKLGAVSVFTPAPEAMMSMSRGVVDAVAGCGDYWFEAYKLTDVGKFMTRDISFGGATLDIFMNKKKYDSLGADVKKIFEDLRKEAIAVNQIGIAAPDLLLRWVHKNQRKGIKYTYFPAGEVEKIEKIAQPLQEEWQKKWEDKGARELFKVYMEERARVLKEFPDGVKIEYKY